MGITVSAIEAEQMASDHLEWAIALVVRRFGEPAEEVAGEALWKAIQSWPGRRDFRAWASVVLANAARNHLRGQGRVELRGDLDWIVRPDPKPNIEILEDVDAALSRVDQVGFGARVEALAELAQCGAAELARAVGLNERTLSRLRRSLFAGGCPLAGGWVPGEVGEVAGSADSAGHGLGEGVEVDGDTSGTTRFSAVYSPREVSVDWDNSEQPVLGSDVEAVVRERLERDTERICREGFGYGRSPGGVVGGRVGEVAA